MRQCFKVAAIVMSVLVLCSGAHADDSKVNPAFDAWSHFGVGSSATYEAAIDSPQGHTATTLSIKLLSKTADHLVVETARTSIVIAGQSKTIAPSQTTIASAYDPTKEITQLGIEDVTAAGQTFSCKIVTPAHPRSGVMNQIKVWASDQVPGAAVKITIDMGQTKVSQILKSFEAK